MSLIEVENLTKHYGSVRALEGVSFQVERGEIIGLLGPNGAGKTTAMKLITGYLQPTSGTARVGGHDVLLDPAGAQSIIGYLPENAPLYLDMSVQDYLNFVADLREIDDSRRRALLSDAIYSTGLQARLTTQIGELSKGFRQRVGLAQAILHKPQVLILDEPTNGLDPSQIVEIRALIRRLAEEATVILSTHILQEVEALCDRAIIIIDGQLRANSKLSELTHTSAAVVAIDRSAKNVDGELRNIPGVTDVRTEKPTDAYAHYRVSGKKDLDLCPLIFDVAKRNDWRLAELRADTKTLESVFRELAERKGIAA